MLNDYTLILVLILIWMGTLLVHTYLDGDCASFDTYLDGDCVGFDTSLDWYWAGCDTYMGGDCAGFDTYLDVDCVGSDLYVYGRGQHWI